MGDLSEYLPKVLSLALTPFTVMWRGFVVTKLWLWFVTPMGLEPIGVAHAVGISILYGVLAWPGYSHDDEDDAMVLILAHGFLGPVLALGFGAIVHAFM